MENLHLQMKDLHDNDFLGIIENNIDPLFSGRAQIRVFRLMDNLNSKDLPWAVPINSTVFAGDGAGSISVPKIGTILRVQFNNGDLYSPEYTTIQNIDTALIEEIKRDYDGTHVLLYDPDEELNVIYQRNRGFQMFYRGSFIQISPDSMITIQHAKQDSLIQLNGDKINIVTKNEISVAASAKISINADETIVSGNSITKVGNAPYSPAVLGSILFPLLQTLASLIDQKAPFTPGVSAGFVAQAKNACLSKNVLIGS